jgi:hypothetical protein
MKEIAHQFKAYRKFAVQGGTSPLSPHIRILSNDREGAVN